MSDQVQIGTSSRGRPGPKPDPDRAVIRQMFSDWSDRTFARYWKAFRRAQALVEYGVVDSFESVLKKASRPNGSINVSKFDQITEAIALDWLARREQEAP